MILHELQKISENNIFLKNMRLKISKSKKYTILKLKIIKHLIQIINC